MMKSASFDPTEMALRLIRDRRNKKQQQIEEDKQARRSLVELNFYSQSSIFTEDVLLHIFSFITNGPLFFQKNLIQVCKMWFVLCHTRVSKLQIGSKFIKVQNPEFFMQTLRGTLLHPQNKRPIQEFIWREDVPMIKEIDFRNSDLEVCSFRNINKLHLEQMQWITSGALKAAVHNLSNSLEDLELKNCIRINFLEGLLFDMFFSGVSFPKLNSLVIETTSNPQLLFQFLNFWTSCKYNAFPVLKSLTIAGATCNEDKFKFNKLNPNKKRTPIKSLTRLMSSIFQIPQVEFFFQYLINCNTIGTFIELPLQLPEHVKHIQLENCESLSFCREVHEHIQTVTIFHIQKSEEFTCALLLRSFPNLQEFQVRGINYPVKVIRQTMDMIQRYGLGDAALNASCFRFMLLISKQIQQFQTSRQLDENLDEQITALQKFWPVSSRNAAFVEDRNCKFYLHNNLNNGANLVQLQHYIGDFDRDLIPILLFEEQLQRWFCAMIRLSFRLHHQCEPASSWIKEMKQDLSCRPFVQVLDLSNNCIEIPAPEKLMGMFRILITPDTK